MRKKGFLQIGAIIAVVIALFWWIWSIFVAIFIPASGTEAVILGAVLLIPEEQKVCHDSFCILPEIKKDKLTGRVMMQGSVSEDYQMRFTSEADNIIWDIPKIKVKGTYALPNCDIKNLKLESFGMTILKNGKKLPFKVKLGKKIVNLEFGFIGKCLASKGKSCF